MSITNQIKTVLLLGILTAILLFIGSFFGRTGLTFAIIIVLAMNLITFFFSDKIILVMYKAKKTTKEEYPNLHKTVEEICKTANIPKPKIFIIPNNHSNAFATGRSKNHSAVAVTQGILNLLNRDELKGVIAHEISHIKNNDILISTISATIAGIITYAAMMARYAAIFGGMRDRDSGNIISILALSILAPIAALIIQLAISRSREYIADETGAKLIHNGKPLADALEKLRNSANQQPLKNINSSTAHMFIVNPSNLKNFLTSIFSTHPNTEDRARRLRKLKF